MTTFVESVARTDLWADWDVRFVATHRPGSARTRAAAFVSGGTRFVRELAGRPDVVHLHTAKGGSFFRKATLLWVARAARTPVLLHVHGGEFGLFYDRMPAPVQRAIVSTFRAADLVVALGEGWAQRLSEIAPGARVVSVPNGIPIGSPSPRAAAGDPIHVVFLGMMTEAKGVFTLVTAWQRLLRDSPGSAPVHLTIAGGGDVERIRRAVTDAELGESVTVRSWLSATEVEGLLRTAHVLTLPSRNEGQPMSILEAMAHGLAVVATHVGGIPDLIDDGATGLLVAPDDPDALAAALGKVVDDSELRSQLGDRAYARAKESFDIATVGRRFDDLYRELVSRQETR